MHIKNIDGNFLLTIKDNSLVRANLSWKNLRGAFFSEVDLTKADLHMADLTGADLSGANLTGANLCRTNLAMADLFRANLTGANMAWANLTETNLTEAVGIPVEVYNLNCSCPPSGDFIGWKKLGGDTIAKLKIPWFSRRCNAIGSRKCRAEMAIVLGIEKDGKPIETGVSKLTGNTTYTVGKHVSCDNYNPDWRVECSGGIHFFMTRKEAEDF